MLISSATFLKSSTSVSQCPPPALPEFAFIGRSNVGKSSLINMIAGKKGLAKTSGTPGKTRLINHFLINEAWYLVDLPGYGYAKISKKAKAEWVAMIRDYLKVRKNLLCIFLLVDVRLSPQNADLEMMDWIADQQKPFTILFTKADKPGKQELLRSVDAYRKFLQEAWDPAPVSITTSSHNARGRDEILILISKMINAGF